MDGKKTKQEKPLHADHRARMQERVRQNGLESLAEHEVLEYLLFFAIPRRDTNALAHRLIRRFGSYGNVLEASEEELQTVEGVGPGTARLLHNLLGFARVYNLSRRGKRPSLRTAEARIQYISPLFFGQSHEALYLILMDDKYIPLRDIRVAEGVPNKVQFDVSRAARAAVVTGGTCAVMAHNHPHGFSVPSDADLGATGAMSKALGILGIDLIDHVIVGEDGATSLAATGRMPYYDTLSGSVRY